MKKRQRLYFSSASTRSHYEGPVVAVVAEVVPEKRLYNSSPNYYPKSRRPYLSYTWQPTTLSASSIHPMKDEHSLLILF